MEKTITEAEIAALKAQAVKEKNTHEEIMKILRNHLCLEITPEKQMEIIKRGRSDEINGLLEACRLHKDSEDAYRSIQINLSAEAQQCIYQTDNNEFISKMLRETKLAPEFEKKLLEEWIASKWTRDFDIYAWKNSGLYQKLSAEGEVYLIKECLDRAQKCNDSRELQRIISYYESYPLSEKGQIALMECLKIPYGRDSLLDMGRACVVQYIGRGLCLGAQKLLVAHGDTQLILDYIRRSERGLEVEEELLRRGNREEIEAYFTRYSFL